MNAVAQVDTAVLIMHFDAVEPLVTAISISPNASQHVSVVSACASVIPSMGSHSISAVAPDQIHFKEELAEAGA